MATNFPSLELPHARRAKDRLVHDLQALARSSERLLEATRDDLSDQARAARRQLSRAIEQVRETTGEWRDRGVAAATTAARETDRVVRENPYRSLGVALGAGVLIGFWLRRRD
jgi:ElaB/YqjD/DUF883 family membrane-anchored ribosome-binding protein